MRLTWERGWLMSIQLRLCTLATDAGGGVSPQELRGYVLHLNVDER